MSLDLPSLLIRISKELNMDAKMIADYVCPIYNTRFNKEVWYKPLISIRLQNNIYSWTGKKKRKPSLNLNAQLAIRDILLELEKEHREKTSYNKDSESENIQIVEERDNRNQYGKSENGLQINTSFVKPGAFGLPLISSGNPVPITGEYEKPGSIIRINDEPHLIVGAMVATTLNYRLFYIEMPDGSMWPGIKSGDFVTIGARLENFRTFYASTYYYVITKSHQCFLRRINPGENDIEIILLADNPDYPSTSLDNDEVLAIFTTSKELTDIYTIRQFPDVSYLIPQIKL